MLHPLCDLAICTWVLIGAALRDDPPPIPTAEMVAALDAADRELRELVVRCRHLQLYGSGAKRPPLPSEVDRERELVYEATWELVLRDDAYRFERTYLDAPPNLAAMIGRSVVHTWDGQVATSIGRNPDLRNPHSISWYSTAPRAHIEGEWAHWLGRYIWSVEGPWDYADILRSPSVIGPTRASDGYTEWEASPASNMRVMLRASRTPLGPRIEEVVIHEYGEGDHVPENLNNITRVRLSERMAELPFLARKAVVTRELPNYEENGGAWGMWIITFESAEPVLVTEDTFRPAAVSGSDVWDERYKIGYTDGRRSILVDGRVLRTHKPVAGEIGPQLDYWVTNGEWVKARRLTAEEMERLQNPHRISRFSMIGGAFVLAGAIIILVPRLRKGVTRLWLGGAR